MTRHLALPLLLMTIALPARAQTPPSPPPQTTVDASRGGVTIASGVNSLTIGARVQFRWTADDRDAFDADTTGSGVGRADGALSQFDVPRLRVSLGGGAFRPWLRYALQFEFSRTGGEGGSRIKDAILEIRPPDRAIRVQMGQFKAPFGLQQMNSSGRLQFVDRAITDAKFTPGRDMGVMVSAAAHGRRIGVDAGVFNGAGESVRQNNGSHLWVGRVWVDPLRPYALAEGASDAPAAPVLHLGASVRGGKSIRGRSPSGTIQDVDNQHAFNVEFAFKSRRVFSTAEAFWMTDARQNPTPGPDIHSRGVHAQAGYMVVPRQSEVGLLYAFVDGSTSLDESTLHEVRGVFGHYWTGHNLKLQADVGQVVYERNFADLPSRAREGLPSLGRRLVAGRTLRDTQLRVQFQLAF